MSAEHKLSTVRHQRIVTAQSFSSVSNKYGSSIMSSGSSHRERAITPHLALVAVQVMFGSWPILGKIVLRSMSATSLVGLRICGAAIVLLILQRKLGELFRLPRRILAWIVL